MVGRVYDDDDDDDDDGGDYYCCWQGDKHNSIATRFRAKRTCKVIFVVVVLFLLGTLEFPTAIIYNF